MDMVQCALIGCLYHVITVNNHRDHTVVHNKCLWMKAVHCVCVQLPCDRCNWSRRSHNAGASPVHRSVDTSGDRSSCSAQEASDDESYDVLLKPEVVKELGGATHLRHFRVRSERAWNAAEPHAARCGTYFLVLGFTHSVVRCVFFPERGVFMVLWY